MAARKKAATGTAIANWDEELAKQAELAAAMEANTGGGQQFFSLKGGILSFDDAPIPGNQMIVIVLDAILENIYHEDAYDPNNPSPPTCFAHGRVEKELEPHADVVERGQQQHDACEGCPMNEWASADTGRGKACKNRRRVSMIPAGTIHPKTGEFELFDDEEHFAKTQAAYMNIPVMSVTGYAAYVKNLKSALRRPPHGVVTKVSVVPDAKSQFRVLFEPVEKAPDELMPILMERHRQAQEDIMFGHNLDEREQEERPARGGNRSKQAVAKKAPRAAAKKAAKAPAKPAAAARGRKY